MLVSRCSTQDIRSGLDVKKIISSIIGEDVYNTWFCDFTYDCSHRTISACAPNRSVETWVVDRYFDTLSRTLESDYNLSIVIKSKNTNKDVILQKKTLQCELSLKPSFDISSKFITDSGNSAVLNIMKNIVENRNNAVLSGKIIHIFGNSGVGKTFIMKLCHESSMNSCYINAKDFMYRYVSSVRSNQGIDVFASQFLSCDIFMIDDIDFLLTKKSTWSTVLNIIDNLCDAGKIVVISSKQKLNTMNKEFIGNISSAIPLLIPDSSFDLCKSFVEKFTQENDIMINEKIIDVIIKKSNLNMRSLSSIMAQIKVQKESNFEFLSDINSCDSSYKGRKIDYNDIQSAVSQYFSIPVDMLKLKTRHKKISTARHISIYLIKEITYMKNIDIAKIFNCKSHAVVTNTVSFINENISQNKEIFDAISSIKSHLRLNH
jgi:chromosomal replication initiation ATPase DnaA